MASRFWVLGTGTWDASDTTHWAASSGAGSGGSSVPGSSDTVTFDGASGGGTVTVNFGGTITIQSITCGAFTGTLDFSANNNSVTLSGTLGLNGSGSATRTINLGSGTFNLTSTSAATLVQFGTTTGLTFSGSSATIEFSGVTANQRTFATGGLSWGTLKLDANASGGTVNIGAPGASQTFASLNISGPNTVIFGGGVTTTVTNSPTIAGSSGSEVLVTSNSFNTQATISSANNWAASWASFMNMAFTGGGTFTASNSFDLAHNTGITITAPASGSPTRARAFTGM